MATTVSQPLPASFNLPSPNPTSATIDGSFLAAKGIILDPSPGFLNTTHSKSLVIQVTASYTEESPTPIISSATNAAGLDLLGRLKRRINLEPRIPALADRLLFQESGFFKFILPVASMALAAMSIYQYPAGTGADVLKDLMPLLLMKLLLVSLLCVCVGEMHQLIFTELAVIAMFVSKILRLSSFFIVILNFLRHNPLLSFLVYITILIVLFGLLVLAVTIYKHDVRKPPSEGRVEEV